MKTVWCQSLGKVFKPCLGYNLLRSVKQIAIADTIVSASNMAIFGAGIYEYLYRVHEGTEDEVQTRIRPAFWIFYYAYWIGEICFSGYIHAAAHHRDQIKCRRWLRIQIVCYLAFLGFYGAHMFWLQGFNIILKTWFGVVSVYKLYTFWVVICFINETTEINKDKLIKDLPDEDVGAFIKGRPTSHSLSKPFETSHSFSLLDSCALEKPYDGKFEINLNTIERINEIGSGEFGTVYKAMYHPNPPLSQRCQVLEGRTVSVESLIVAVKTVKSTADASYFQALLAELKIMIFIGRHTNIVNLIGASTTHIKERKLDLVVEYCPYKSLDLHLQSRKGLFVNQMDAHRNIIASPEQFKTQDLLTTGNSNFSYLQTSVLDIVSTEDLVRWSIDTAKGMEYLYARTVIHGDLAARNVLLTQDKRAKISDFGLSRRIYKYKKRYVTAKQTLLPWRWMAPESLNHHLKFFLESDIWSFGVTLWEFFSLGDMPYSDLDFTHDFVSQLQIGATKLDIPLYAPSKVYEIMLNCLKFERSERMSYREIISSLETILKEFRPAPKNHRSTPYPSPQMAIESGSPDSDPDQHVIPSAIINAAKLFSPSFVMPNASLNKEFHLHVYPYQEDIKKQRPASYPIVGVGGDRKGKGGEITCTFGDKYVLGPRGNTSSYV